MSPEDVEGERTQTSSEAVCNRHRWQLAYNLSFLKRHLGITSQIGLNSHCLAFTSKVPGTENTPTTQPSSSNRKH